MKNTGIEGLALVAAFGLVLGACGGGGGGSDADDGGPGGTGGSMAGADGSVAGTTGAAGASPDATGAAGTGTDGGVDASDAPAGDAPSDVPVGVDAPVEVAPVDAASDAPVASGSWADLYVCGTLGWGAKPAASAFFADGASVAMVGVGVKVFDVATGAVKRTYGGLAGDVVSVAVSADGARLAASVASTDLRLSGPRVVVWRVSDGAILWTRPGLVGVLSVAFSPDGTLLAMGDTNDKVILANAATGATVRTYAEHTQDVGGVVFSPDGTLVASTDTSAALKIWKSADLATQRTLQGTSPPLRYDAIFSADGTQIFSSGLGRKYKVSDGTTVGPAISSTGLFSPDGLSYYVSPTLYRASDSVPLRTANPAGGALAFKVDSSGLLIAPEVSNAPAKPYLMRAVDGAKLIELPGDALEAATAAVSLDGKRAFVGRRMYDLALGTTLYETPFVTSDKAYAVFSPDGTLVAAAQANGTLVLMKVADGTIVKSIIAHASAIRAIAFSPTGDRVATASDDNFVKIWSTPALAELRAIGPAGARSLSWSPDGASLAGGGVTSSVVWRVADGQVLKTLSAPGRPVFSPDGSKVRLFGTFVVQTFDLVGNAPVEILDVPGGDQIPGRNVTSAGDVFAAASRGIGAELWSLPGGKSVTMLDTPPLPAGLFFAPDRVVLADSDPVRKIVSWCKGPALPPVVVPPDPGGPIATVCGATRAFTGDFDGDDVNDCVYWPANTTSLQFHKGVGGGQVRTVPVSGGGAGFCLGSSSYRNVVVADPNGDGKDDLVVIGAGFDLTPTTAALMTGREDGLFRCPGGPSPVPLATYVANGTVPIVGDFTGDGGNDVLLIGFTVPSFANSNVLHLTVLDGDRTSLALRSIYTDTKFIVGATGSVTSVSVSDVNIDGKLDVVTNVFVRYLNGTGPGATTLTWYGKGDGTFSQTAPP